MHRVLVALLVIGVVLGSSPGRCPATTLPRSVTVANRHESRPLALPDELGVAPDVQPACVARIDVRVDAEPAPVRATMSAVPPIRPAPLRRPPLRLAAPSGDPAH